MSHVVTVPAGSDGFIQIQDNSDDLTKMYVDLWIGIPVAGANLPDFYTTADIDGIQVYSQTLNLTFTYGYYNYWLARINTGYSGRNFVWHFPGGDTLGGAQDLETVLDVSNLGLIRFKEASVWHLALPYVKDAGIWKRAKPYIKASDGWLETTIG